MRKERVLTAERTIPGRLGNKLCGLWPYLLSIMINALIHVGIGLHYGTSVYGVTRLVISFLFFIYPSYFVADVLWSMHPDVSAILSGKTKINRKYYANMVRAGVSKDRLFPVTISIPVYTEENAVIFETIRQSIAAAAYYRTASGQSANIVISDDGLAPMLGGYCTRAQINDLMLRYAYYMKPHYTDHTTSHYASYAKPLHPTAMAEEWSLDGGCLNEKELAAAERILFYRENGVGFVARPAKNRAGKFKKASNLNFTLRLGDSISRGGQQGSLFADGGEFERGYAEGDISTHEIILLLDKDSGVHPEIIGAVVPEFACDAELAYVQCATNALNLYDNYFAKAVGRYTNNLFQNIWPCKALQGFFVPLVGHNVFLRKSLLEESGWWSENKVSEDYDKAIGFYNIGYHGKYMQLAGLEFTEYVSRTFSEETGKQFRYSYGLLEMLLQGTIQSGKTRACDALYMVLYFFSLVNSVMLFPAALLENYFGNVHFLWAGFFICNLGFILLPCVRSFCVRRLLPKEQLTNPGYTSILALSFLGHAYSNLAGVCRFFIDLLRPNSKPFPSTSVDTMKYSFADGLKIIGEHFRKNKGLLFLAVFCIERGVFMLTGMHVGLPTLVTYSYIFLVSILVPILLTPQLFPLPAQRQAKIRVRLSVG